ncbi:oligosaccharide flippase family protein [Sphingobacterium sp.]|uniref:oligosaccharide flippase family protein n=1 Tax=Sphingobacterium sp. TaxID=341027 RepID=UPI00289B148A|nr:oligosaccharide flippase family protein [Sphingobacterium sp.]
MLNKYLNTIAFALLDNISKILSVLVVNAVIARILDVAGFGQYSYYVFLSSFFISISKFGLENVILLESARQPKDKFLGIVNSAFLLRILVSIVLTFVAILSYQHLSIPLKYLFIVVLPLFFGTFDFSELYFLARQKNKIITISKFILSIFFLLLRVSLLFIELDNVFEIVILLYVFDFLCTMVLHGIMLSKEKIHVGLRYVNKKILFVLFKRGSLLLGAGMSIFIIMRINTFFIEKYCSFYDLGIYSPAIKVCELSNAFIILIINVLTPVIVKDQLKVEHKTGIYSFLFWCSLICIFPLFIFSKFFLLILFGGKYVDGEIILRITLLSIPFVALGMLQGRFFVNQMKDRLNLIRMLISAVFTLLMSYILIRQYGIEGAAYAYLFSQVFTNFFVDLFFKETIRDFLIKTFAIAGLKNTVELIKMIFKTYYKNGNKDIIDRV